MFPNVIGNSLSFSRYIGPVAITIRKSDFRIYTKYARNNFKDVFSIGYVRKYIFMQIWAETQKNLAAPCGGWGV